MSKKSIKCLRFMDNLSSNTIKSYNQAIRLYEKFHGITIEEAIDEALEEQTKQVPHHQLKVIDRIEEFQDYLIHQELVVGTIKTHMSRIKAIYHKNRVELPYIEPINPKQVRKNPVIEFKDILTKDELKKVLPLVRLPVRARMMVMIQGGLSNEECEQLTLRRFIDELYPHHLKEDDVSALEWLADENNPVIWITKLIRVKTGKPYYAIIGAEAVNVIASAKLYEKDLPKNNGTFPEKLLNTHKSHMNRICSKINKRLGLGEAGGMYRLRPHALRKFHATYIGGSALSYDEQSIITNAEIDEMQGRGKTNVQDTYIKTNPLRQKVLYAKVMNNVSLWHEYDYIIEDNDVEIFLVDPANENKKLRKEVEHLTKQLEQKKVASDKVNALRKELGDDVFKEMIGEILNAS